ncbi:IPT/TIG domain-containing protein [Streptomyces sp.]|uniref:IPT/TIG domain-containing protein n=1 Tax=Streptomyces sp. TaxID=1931 RepID=UPI0039C99ED0
MGSPIVRSWAASGESNRREAGGRACRRAGAHARRYPSGLPGLHEGSACGSALGSMAAGRALPVAGGSTVTVSGRQLASASSVQFGGSTVTPTVVSDQELTVVSPAGAAGRGGVGRGHARGDGQHRVPLHRPVGRDRVQPGDRAAGRRHPGRYDRNEDGSLLTAGRRADTGSPGALDVRLDNTRTQRSLRTSLRGAPDFLRRERR